LDVTKAGIESSAAFSQGGSESADIATLEASSTAFNQSVALIANAEQQVNNDYLIIAEIDRVAAANDITISNLTFQGGSSPILIAGTAQSATQISAFRNAIQNDPHFGPVNLPLLNAQGNNVAYTFSMTFPLSSSGF
jgi:hypothetical protein